VRLLLDTHIALWSVARPDRLSAAARSHIAAATEQPRVSVVSLWEIAIKFSLGRSGPNAMRISAERAHALFFEAGFDMLAVGAEHAIAVERLKAGEHKDPFDRLLVAQAMSEPLILLTHDAALVGYSDVVRLV
jgi:PIN domain nuclease of toxin-antitoxin system